MPRHQCHHGFHPGYRNQKAKYYEAFVNTEVVWHLEPNKMRTYRVPRCKSFLRESYREANELNRHLKTDWHSSRETDFDKTGSDRVPDSDRVWDYVPNESHLP